MSKRTVVYIDDDDDDIELMRGVLTSDYDVIYYASADEAWEKCLKDPSCDPLLILSDGQMPRMTGYELQEKVKKASHLKHVPFIFLTTTDRHYSTSWVCNQGYFAKPNSVEQLKKMITLIIDYWSASVPPIRK